MLFFAQLFIFSMIEMKNVSLKENENVVVTGVVVEGNTQ